MKLSESGIRVLYCLLAVTAALGAGTLFWKKAGRTHTFELLKLCAFAETNQALFVAPDGRNISLVIGVPKTTEFNPEPVHGMIEIYSGSALVKGFNFALTNGTAAGWLDSYGMSSWIISWPRNESIVQLDPILASGNKFLIRAKINDGKAVSLWLAYTQSWEKRDRKAYVLTRAE